MGKRALITGITGQDGSYLTELLLDKGYYVTGLIRCSTRPATRLIDPLLNDPTYRHRIQLVQADLTDQSRLYQALETTAPDEIYHLGAQSHVPTSYDNPVYTADVTGLATLRLLEAIRAVCPTVRFYNAASSEIFGQAQTHPQDESTPLNPQSPYGIAKAFSTMSTRSYRENYQLHACNGILFNHESPRRAELFVTRKITCGIARIVAGKQTHIELGNTQARRDWGYAPDYVDAIWRIMQHPDPSDYVIATGVSHSVAEFAGAACALVGLDWEDVIVPSEHYYRPNDIQHLVGNARKAKRELGWEARTSFDDLVRLMLDADLALEGLSLPCPV